MFSNKTETPHSRIGVMASAMFCGDKSYTSGRIGLGFPAVGEAARGILAKGTASSKTSADSCGVRFPEIPKADTPRDCKEIKAAVTVPPEGIMPSASQSMVTISGIFSLRAAKTAMRACCNVWQFSATINFAPFFTRQAIFLRACDINSEKLQSSSGSSAVKMPPVIMRLS